MKYKGSDNVLNLLFAPENKNRQQWKLGGLVFWVVIIIGYLIYNWLLPELVYSWFFGVAVGFILQRSRICFTAAFRDPVLFGMTELSRALLLSMMIASLGYAGLQYFQVSNGLAMTGKFIPLGWHLPIGAFIFGLGAAVSGGCASGTLMRMGEGFQMQWFVLIGFILGSVHGAHDVGWWYRLFGVDKTTHLPSLLGWKWGVGFQLVILGLLYGAAYWWEKRKFS